MSPGINPLGKFFVTLLLLAAAPAFAQLDSHTVSITATRQISVPPDQAVFSIAVTSGAATNLDQIVAALSPLNLTSANLSGVVTSAPPALQWNFTLPVPLPSLTSTIALLTQLQQTIPQNNSGLTLTFSVYGTQVSAQLQQSQPCANADLISDATTQAQKLASAAGMTLGPILKLSNAPSIQLPSGFGEFLVGDFVDAIAIVPAPAPIACSLVVEFQLLP